MIENPENRIDVGIQTQYLDDQSNPENHHYVFSYTITIQNSGSQGARLLTRHWVITDANGKVQEVQGEGVVGEKPYLSPGQKFEYSSGTFLDTPVGSMHGSYGMVADDGSSFKAAIPAFSLAVQGLVH